MALSSTSELKQLVALENDRMIDIRRQLHRNPELGFDERRTTSLINDVARSLDLSDRPYPADTSFSSNPPKKLWAEFSDLPGCNIEMTVNDHNPAVINNPAVTGLVRNVVQDVVGAEGVLAMPPVSPSDDVSEFLNRIPGSYFFVGAGKADHSSGMHHNPQFSINEVCMPVAGTILATATVNTAQPN